MAHKPAVLVTRPAGQGEALGEAVRRLGFEPCHRPLLELQPLSELSPSAQQCVRALDRYRHVIFISANAVRFGLPWIDELWPRLPTGVTWYAIGSSTAAALRARDIEVLEPPAEMTSEGLLQLPTLAQAAGQEVLIVKGEGGRATLREELSRRGARVDELPCYRRRRPSLAPGELSRELLENRVRLILVSSGEGLENLLALLSPEETTKFRSVTLVVPSPRVGRMAGQAGFRHVLVAENASDQAMTAALESWACSGRDSE